MTVDRMLFKDLLEKGSDADLLNEIMTFAINRMMDLEVESLTGAAHGERSALRTNQRNGYRERPWGRALAQSRSRSPSSGRAATSPPSWSHDGLLRRR
jgi:transposase-like protein